MTDQPEAPLSGPIRLTVPAGQGGERIDRFVAGALATMSRSRIKTLIEEGRLSSASGPVTQPAEPVKEGHTYILDVPAPLPAVPQPQLQRRPG